MITVTETDEYSTNDRVYMVRVPYMDMVTINLDPLDRAVLGQPAKSAADVLQNLQILAFRQEQQEGK